MIREEFGQESGDLNQPRVVEPCEPTAQGLGTEPCGDRGIRESPLRGIGARVDGRMPPDAGPSEEFLDESALADTGFALHQGERGTAQSGMPPRIGERGPFHVASDESMRPLCRGRSEPLLTRIEG